MDGSIASHIVKQIKPVKNYTDYWVIHRSEIALHLPVNIPGHSKVTNFGYSSCSSTGQKAIPCSYISLKNLKIKN